MQIKIEGGILNVSEITVPPIVPPIEPPVVPPIEPPVEKIPYFDVGEGTGKRGDTVTVSVEGGCVGLMSGFHIGGGVGKLDGTGSGYRLFQALSVELGEFLHDYLKLHGAITEDDQGNETAHYWSIFQFVKADPNRALPEEWWEYALGFFSLSQERTVPPVAIPSGTELFKLRIKILAATDPGNYELTCEDEYYYTQSHQRRRDFLYTNDRQGYTKIETLGGKLTVTA